MSKQPQRPSTAGTKAAAPAATSNSKAPAPAGPSKTPAPAPAKALAAATVPPGSVWGKSAVAVEPTLSNAKAVSRPNTATNGAARNAGAVTRGGSRLPEDVPFPCSFLGECTECHKKGHVSTHAEFAKAQYCKACWTSWWLSKDRDRSQEMSREKDALRAQPKLDHTVWNSVCATVTAVQVYSYPFVIEKTENISEIMRRKVLFAYMRQVMDRSVIDSIVKAGFLITGATAYSSVDIRKVDFQAPLRRTIRVGALETQVELLVGEAAALTLDLAQGGEVMLQYLNVVLGKALELGGLTFCGKVYCDDTRAKVYNDMVVVPGYFASIQVLNKAAYLVVHPRTRVRATATALDILSRPHYSDRDLVGQFVVSSYGNKKRQYRVYKVDRTTSPRGTFTLKTGATKSFAEYYEDQYGVRVYALDQPMLWGDREGKVLLVPELMLLDEIAKEAKRTLPTRCSRMPGAFHQECSSFINRLKGDTVSGFLRQQGITVTEPTLKSVPVRELKPIAITLAGGSKLSPNQDFGPVTMRLKLSCPRRDVTVMAWGDDARTLAEQIININEQIQGAWKQKGEIKHIAGTEEDPTFVERCVASLPKVGKGASASALPAVLVICSLKNGHSHRGEAAYGSLKLELGRAGVASHFIDYGKFSTNRAADAYIHNITKNVSSKMGEMLWHINLTQHVPELQGGTVYIGYDVYHDRRTESSATGAFEFQRRSLAGFVAWYHRPDDKWFHLCDVDLHVSRQEILNSPSAKKDPKEGKEANGGDHAAAEGDAAAGADGANRMTLQAFVSEVFKRIVKDGKCARVVVYRDGVGDSQLAAVKDTEVPQVRDAIPKATQLAFIVVQKRIHDRYISNVKLPGSEKPEWHNVTRGFVVDYTPNTFLQIAVDCTLSTSKPVKYVVLTPGKLTMDSIQNATFALCWMYSNWPGSIKVPFVLQCAHKLAYFHGTAHAEHPRVHTALKTQPYYL